MPMWKERLRRRQSFSTDKTKRIATLAKLAFAAVLVIAIGSFVAVPLFAFDLPSPDKIIRKEGFSTKILDRNGEVLYDIFADQRRTPIEISQVPEYLREATIATEDKNFYRHSGFDVFGMIRGFSRIVTKGRAEGGSTLTQQLVKNVLLTAERSLFRKVREFILAVQIESKYSKDEILQMYLNEAPYGGTAWGVEAAAETYFGKKVVDLDLIESAFLAGLPQRPSTYSPYSSTPTAYVGRTREVLRRMREDGYINKEQEELAASQVEELTFQPRGASFKAPHFVQYVQSLLVERYGERVVEQGGLKVTTTLDLELQEEAQSIVTEEIEKVEKLHITNGAALALDPETGEILSMVGSKNFNADNYDGQVNVTLSLRQPGSSFKPITYVTAFKKGYSPATMLMDVPTTFPGGDAQPLYKPVNYDGKYRGPMQLRYALGNSINVIAVKTLALVGIRDTLQTAYDLGINSLEPTKETLGRVGLSLTLGGGEVKLLELTGAYGAFVNKGFRVDPVAILKVEDADGRVLEEVDPKKGRRVLSEEEAFLIADVLSDNRARTEIFGPNSALNIRGRQIAVKTGTTNDQRDNWTVGGNSQLMVGVWVGNNDNSPMKQVASGVTGASPIWRRIILEGLAGKPNASFSPPGGIVSASVDNISGYKAHDGFPSRIEYFIKGTEPTGDDLVHVKLKVCKSDNNKLASPGDTSSGNFDEKEFFVFKEEDPTGSGTNRWQEGILNWLNKETDQRYKPPTEYCNGDNSSPINIEFISPHDQAQVGNKFTMEVNIQATDKITEVNFEADGQEIRSFSGSPYKFEAELENGVHKLRVVAKDDKGRESDKSITVGVNVPWDSE